MRSKEAKVGVIVVAIVVILWVLHMVLTHRETQEERLLPYRVLHRDTRGGKASLSVLVEPNSAKEEVMELARHLRQRHDRYSHIFVNIYDSEEVWRKHRDESYSSKELYEHWLVHMVCDKADGYDEIQWMQEEE